MTEVPQEQRALSPIEAMRGTLVRMQPEFAAALPPQIPAEKFIRTAMTAVQMQPDLLNADRRSLMAACMKAAQDGLLPDGRESAFVIFRGKAGAQVQFMPMIGGLLKKLRNSGDLSSISANVVYERDEFTYELGDEEFIKHKPYLGSERGKPIAVYAIAKLKDGSVMREVMSVDEVEKVRNVSRAKDSGPWSQWWGEMARKTVLRRLMKRLPSSSDLDRVLESDNETYDLRQANPVAATISPIDPMAHLKAQIIVDEPEVTIEKENTNDANHADN